METAMPLTACRRAALYCLAFAFLLPAGPARSDSAPAEGQITWDDARELVEKTLGDDGYKVKGAGFELNAVNDARHPGFYSFEAFQSMRLRRVKIEYYAVNSVTAEVWKKTACEQANTPSLEPLQKALREKYKLQAPGSDPDLPCAKPQ
jgi:hypothetical protein